MAQLYSFQPDLSDQADMNLKFHARKMGSLPRLNAFTYRMKRQLLGVLTGKSELNGLDTSSAGTTTLSSYLF